MCYLLNLKFEYLCDAKRDARREYKRKKGKCEIESREINTRNRILAKIISKISEESREEWEKGEKTIKEKSDWLKARYRKPEPETHKEDEDEASWLSRIVQGRGKGRKWIKIKIPVFSEG